MLTADPTQMGKFSSDRAIVDYAQEYWNIEPQKLA
jgi:glucan phosphorylase